MTPQSNRCLQQSNTYIYQRTRLAMLRGLIYMPQDTSLFCQQCAISVCLTLCVILLTNKVLVQEILNV